MRSLSWLHATTSIRDCATTPLCRFRHHRFSLHFMCDNYFTLLLWEYRWVYVPYKEAAVNDMSLLKRLRGTIILYYIIITIIANTPLVRWYRELTACFITRKRRFALESLLYYVLYRYLYDIGYNIYI